MLLDAISDEELISRCIINGGLETLNSFGISSYNKLETKYLDFFFRSLQLFFKFDDYLFVHTGFNDEIENPFNDSYHMIWKSRDKYFHPLLKDKIIVHGHRVIPSIICDERIKNNDRVINLDTGCVYTDYSGYGRLTALEIHSREIFFV